MLYGCEICCPSRTDLDSKLQIRDFFQNVKIIKSKPTCMVYGELGEYPLEIQAKCRMLLFWFKIGHSNNPGKLSCVLYTFLHVLYNTRDDYKLPYLSFV